MHNFLIASPLILLAVLAVSARIGISPFETVSYSQKTHDEIKAYIAPVQATEKAGIHGSRRPESKKLKAVAQLWIDGIQSGRLKPLYIEHRRDTVREGIKGQIRASAQKLLTELSNQAETEANSDPAEAVRTIRTGFEISQSLKYSDLFAIGYFAMRERKFIHTLFEIMPKLSKAELLEVNQFVAEIDNSNNSLAQTVHRTERVYWIDGYHVGRSKHLKLNALDQNSPNVVMASAVNREVADDEWQTVRSFDFAKASLDSEEKLLRKLKDQLAKQILSVSAPTESR